MKLRIDCQLVCKRAPIIRCWICNTYMARTCLHITASFCHVLKEYQSTIFLLLQSSSLYKRNYTASKNTIETIAAAIHGGTISEPGAAIATALLLTS